MNLADDLVDTGLFQTPTIQAMHSTPRALADRPVPVHTPTDTLPWSSGMHALGLPFFTPTAPTPMGASHWVSQNRALGQALGLSDDFYDTYDFDIAFQLYAEGLLSESFRVNDLPREVIDSSGELGL